jgi:NAD(P) transhydrogenase subunit beta
VQELLFELLYLASTLLFILGIKRLSRVKTAKSGNQLAALGMLLAIAGVVLQDFQEQAWFVLIAGLIVGGGIGLYLARTVQMTAMPEMVAALNGFGGGASALVAMSMLGQDTVSGMSLTENHALLDSVTYPLSILIGLATFSGSGVAYLKLQGKKIPHPLPSAQRNLAHIVLAVVAVVVSLWLIHWATGGFSWFLAALLLSAIALVLGVSVVLPIGGADMPVVVSLLNSYSGVAAAMSGFVVKNPLLVVAGALVGASGLILTQIMCKAMNRSLGNVLAGGIGDDTVAKDATDYKGVKSAGAEEIALLFDGAQQVIMVPGYGLAVSQAQHILRELGDLLEQRGTNVRYAIHPVAGRMPGHMNVLLAESDVPYDKLVEMEHINADFKNTDVVLVVGANDVVNPAARTDPKSPIAGMPILDVDYARTVVVIKRSLSPGYAGIKNPLFEAENCLMMFQDAKQALQELVAETKAL